MRGSLAARLLGAVIRRQADAAVLGDPDSPMARHAESMLEQTPLRMFLLDADGSMTPELLDGLLQLMNGRLVEGARALVRAIRERRASE